MKQVERERALASGALQAQDENDNGQVQEIDEEFKSSNGGEDASQRIFSHSNSNVGVPVKKKKKKNEENELLKEQIR